MVTLISTPLSFFLFLSRHSLPSSQRNFLLSQSHSAYTPALFSFHASISGLPGSCFSFSQISNVIHPEISRFPFYILPFMHMLFTIIINVFPIFQSHPCCINTITLAHSRTCLCTPDVLAPLSADRDEKMPSNFITHRGTISIMKYFGEYFGPRVNSI